MAMHRANPACRSCHIVIDPIGLALDHFDVTGAWRIKDRGVPVKTDGELYDGTKLAGAPDLRAALVAHSDVIITHFTEMLMSYALGRRIEPYDMPTIRRIVSSIGRRHRLAPAEVEDFTAEVQLRLISDDYGILRKFQSRCSLRTFLTVVIQRMFLDYRNANWGKWRPSLRSRREGRVAVLFERLTVRDGLILLEKSPSRNRPRRTSIAISSFILHVPHLLPASVLNPPHFLVPQSRQQKATPKTPNR